VSKPARAEVAVTLELEVIPDEGAPFRLAGVLRGCHPGLA
jgi:hypothetical protein